MKRPGHEDDKPSNTQPRRPEVTVSLTDTPDPFLQLGLPPSVMIRKKKARSRQWPGVVSLLVALAAMILAAVALWMVATGDDEETKTATPAANLPILTPAESLTPEESETPTVEATIEVTAEETPAATDEVSLSTAEAAPVVTPATTESTAEPTSSEAQLSITIQTKKPSDTASPEPSNTSEPTEMPKPTDTATLPPTATKRPTRTPPPTLTPRPSPEPTETPEIFGSVTAAAGAKLRSGPGTKYEQLATLMSGEEVRLLGKYSHDGSLNDATNAALTDWLKIRTICDENEASAGCEEVEGWVSVDLILVRGTDPANIPIFTDADIPPLP